MVANTSAREDNAETEPLLIDNSDAKAAVKGSARLLILIICGIVILAADFGFFLSQAPQTAVFEQIICRKHGLQSREATNATLGEMDPCKSEAVQSEVALILGYKDTFDVLPGILLSLPYGVLSDHWGRRPVVYLGIIGIVLGEAWLRLVCYFSNIMPLRLAWLSGLFRLIGGGDQVLAATALTMVADIFSEDERSTALFRLQSCVLLAEILATPVSAYLMTYDPAIPYVLGLIIVVAGVMPALFLPETLVFAKARKLAQPNATSTGSSETAEAPGKQGVLQELIHQAREFKDSTKFIWLDTNVRSMVFISFVCVMYRQTTNVLLQYASKKFNWSLARASLLISVRGIVSVVNYLALMPFLTFLAARYLNMHGKYRDWRLSQCSGIVSIVGFAAMGLAPVPFLFISGLVILSLGSAFTINVRSLVTALVLPDHVGTLYSAIGISQSLGTFVAGPLFAYLFKLGMHLGDAWMGMPFLQGAVFFVVATVVVWRVQIQATSPDEVEEQQEQLLSE